jgi:hypothetical protein
MKSGSKVPAFLSPTPEGCFDVVELLCIGKVDKVWRSPDKAVYVHVKFDDGTADEYELPRAIVELPNEAAELRVAAATHTSTPADETIRITELEPGIQPVGSFLGFARSSAQPMQPSQIAPVAEQRRPPLLSLTQENDTAIVIFSDGADAERAQPLKKQKTEVRVNARPTTHGCTYPGKTV